MSSVLKSTDFLEPLGVDEKETDEKFLRHVVSVFDKIMDLYSSHQIDIPVNLAFEILQARNSADEKADEIASDIVESKQRAEKRRKEIIAILREAEAMTKAERDEQLMAAMNRTCYD